MSDDYEIGDASRRAASVVSQERDSHGNAYTNHRQIARLWSAFLDDQLDEDILLFDCINCRTRYSVDVLEEDDA